MYNNDSKSNTKRNRFVTLYAFSLSSRTEHRTRVRRGAKGPKKHRRKDPRPDRDADARVYQLRVFSRRTGVEIAPATSGRRSRMSLGPAAAGVSSYPRSESAA